MYFPSGESIMCLIFNISLFKLYWEKRFLDKRRREENKAIEVKMGKDHRQVNYCYLSLTGERSKEAKC